MLQRSIIVDEFRILQPSGAIMTNIANIAVLRLNEGARAALIGHFSALSTEDRRLRFGSSLAVDAIAAYVEAIDFERDAVFGVHDDALVLIGVAHTAFGDDQAELGLSVLPEHRGRGVGSALFERAAEHARNRFVSKLFMHCLSENAAVVRIARRAGMDIVIEAGDADAHLMLPPASPESITGEYMTDRFALYDYALKAHVAAWNRINEALEQARTAEAIDHALPS
jgi:GNAT superfamily N-acetyltransferase